MRDSGCRQFRDGLLQGAPFVDSAGNECNGAPVPFPQGGQGLQKGIDVGCLGVVDEFNAVGGCDRFQAVMSGMEGSQCPYGVRGADSKGGRQGSCLNVEFISVCLTLYKATKILP